MCVPVQISALPRAAGGWGLPGRVERGSVRSHTPCVPREEPARLDRMPGVCDLPLGLATAASLP